MIEINDTMSSLLIAKKIMAEARMRIRKILKERGELDKYEEIMRRAQV